MSAKILSFGLPEIIRTVNVPREHLRYFLQHPETWPLLKNERAWLDAQAPGWFLDVRIHDGQMGSNTIGIDLLVFLQNQHQRLAWRARLIEEDEEELLALEKEFCGTTENMHCTQCGESMHPYDGDGIVRIAQFAFIVRERGLQCSCGHMFTNHTPVLYPIMEQISRRIGLPLPGDVGWSESVTDERIRRRSNPPELEIPLSENDSYPEILEKLDRMIQIKMHKKIS